MNLYPATTVANSFADPVASLLAHATPNAVISYAANIANSVFDLFHKAVSQRHL